MQLLAQCTFESNSIYVFNNKVNRDRIVASWHRGRHRYENFKPGSEDAYLRAVETPPISDQLQAMVMQVQTALPNVLALTNKIAAVLDNAAEATSNLNVTLVETRPMITNFALISAQLREPGGPLVWALGTNGNGQLQGTLTNANALLGHVDTNLNALLGHTDTNLAALLINLANITSNLNAQVQANSNMIEQHLQNRRGHRRFCSGIEAALAVALGVQAGKRCCGKDQRAAAGFAAAATALNRRTGVAPVSDFIRKWRQARRLSYVWLFLNHSANNLMPCSNFTCGL